MTRHIETFDASWNGIQLAITWEPHWLSTGDDHHGWDNAHLQIEAVSPDRAMLPITETGYRSHFTTAEIVAGYGGPVAFVLAWLDEEAAAPVWQQRVAAARQLTLF